MTILDDGSLAYSMAGFNRRKNPYDTRRALAQQMMAQGTDTSPIQSPWQGVARLAQAMAGAYGSYKADVDEKADETKRNETLGAELAKLDPNGNLTGIAKLDPSLALKIAGQGLIEKQKLETQQGTRATAADGFGMSYGLPPQGGQVQQSPLPPPGQDSAANAIAGIESGGRYDAVGPVANKQGNRAYGKYQVLDTNIAPWTQEVLGRPMSPEEFLANPQAQDAVFKAKFGQYQQKYGPEGASRAWFAGEGGMNNPGAADVNGMTVQRYGQRFAQAMPPQPGQAPPAPPVTVQATPPGAPLTINMQGPGGVPQGSADGATPPMQGAPPPPQAPGGMPAVTAQPPAIPDVPRPQPTPQQIRRAQDQILAGVPRAQAEAAMNAEVDRDWGVARDRAKMEYERQFGEYKSTRERTEKQPQQQFDNSNKLRDEFQGSVVVKNYRDITPIMESMKDAATRPSRAADLNMVYALAKIMDPGSVVREGEMIMVNNTQGIGDRLAGMINSLNGGATLTPEARARILEEAQSRYKGLEQNYKALEDHYGGMADRFGLRREDVIVPIRKPAGGTTPTSPEDLKKKYGLE